MKSMLKKYVSKKYAVLLLEVETAKRGIYEQKRSYGQQDEALVR